MNHIIWHQLLSLSDTLNDNKQTKADRLKLLKIQLESIDIAHEHSFDPAENFEEYVALALCQAIKEVIEE